MTGKRDIVTGVEHKPHSEQLKVTENVYELLVQEKRRRRELEEQYQALHAAATEMADFLWHEKETKEPSQEDLDNGYVALESSADYEREEALGEKLLIALGRDPNEVSSPAKRPT